MFAVTINKRLGTVIFLLVLDTVKLLKGIKIFLLPSITFLRHPPDEISFHISNYFNNLFSYTFEPESKRILRRSNRPGLFSNENNRLSNRIELSSNGIELSSNRIVLSGNRTVQSNNRTMQSGIRSEFPVMASFSSVMRQCCSVMRQFNPVTAPNFVVMAEI